MKWLLSICALECFTSVSTQTMTSVLLEAQTGRETGVFFKISSGLEGDQCHRC